MKKSLLTCVLLGLMFWACRNTDQEQDIFDLIGDSTWTSCDSVLIVLKDASGKALDTLFNDSLTSINQLKRLSADKYPGGKAVIFIQGKKGGGLCFEQTRSFDNAGGNVKVDTVFNPAIGPSKVTVDRDTLYLSSDDAPVAVKAAALPAYVEQSFQWSLDHPDIASLEFPGGPTSASAKVKPLKAGLAIVTVRSKKDSTKSAKLVVKVISQAVHALTLSADSLNLTLGGPDDSLAASISPDGSDQRVKWIAVDSNLVQVDSLGRIHARAEGRARVTVRSLVYPLEDTAVIIIRKDLPQLTVASKSGAPVNVPIVFSPKATHYVGTFVMYKWDLNGDGVWDDSLSGPWLGDSVDLPAVTYKYPNEGSYVAKFLVRDNLGNEAKAEVNLDIGNQAPEVQAIRADTTISIKDSIAMTARVHDVDGKVAWCGWDYDGDGKFDDSAAFSDSTVDFDRGHRYNDTGSFSAVLRAVDGNGKARLDTVKIKVVLDPPVADAGRDTTVYAGASLLIKAKGTDKFGSIVKRELKVGTGSFLALSKQDTVIQAPADSGILEIVVRVTDDDGLSASDTMHVTVLPVVLTLDNADLSALNLSTGTLEPAFKAATVFFSARVPYTDSLVSVAAFPADPAAHVAVNGKPTAAGTASDSIKIPVGTNVNLIQVVVTAQQGNQKVYSVSVSRDPVTTVSLSKLDAGGFKLNPAFASTVLEYQDTVTESTASVTLTPKATQADAKISVNDSVVADGTVTNALPLRFGDNLFTVLVSGHDGIAKTIYRIKVTRLAKLVISRKIGSQGASPSDSVNLLPGASSALSTPAQTGYHFVKWTLLEGTALILDTAANPTTLTLKAGRVGALANFDINKYTITADLGKGGRMVPGTVSVDYGASQAYAITSSAGYRLSSVTVDGASDSSALGGSYTFSKVSADHSISASFTRIFSIAASFGPGGSVSPANVNVDTAANQTLSITPASGYRILSFKVDSVEAPAGYAGSYTFTSVAASHTVQAIFLRTFAINTSAGPGGTLTPVSSSIDSGSSRTFTVKALAGYRFLALTDSGVDITASVTDTQFTLTSVSKAHNLVATFMKTYTITASGSVGGSISPTSVTVDSGTSKTITISPSTGYYISAMTDGGTDIRKVITGDSSGGTYSLSNINANHAFSASFSLRISVLSVYAPASHCIESNCGAGTLTQTVQYGVATTISTPTTFQRCIINPISLQCSSPPSYITYNFNHWESPSGTTVPGAATTSVTLYGNSATYTAVYVAQ